MIAGVLDDVFGVPTHPLAVHAPVVLVPIAAVVAVVLAARSDWRVRVGWVMPAAVLVLVAMLFVAKESGESAKEAENVFGDVARHEDLANATFVLSLVWLVLTLAVAVRDRMGVRDRQALASLADAAIVGRDTIGLVLAILAAAAAVITTVWLIRTGHAGAESRWKVD